MISAHEADRLVLFCGAGVSLYAGLPAFKRLVDRLIACFRPDLSDAVKAERRRRNYDRVLNHVERTHPSGAIRAEVKRILTSRNRKPLTTHQALLTLATKRDGRTRLVTTNFDRLFDDAGLTAESAIAPRLPVPKPHEWNSVVYLHGKIDDTDPEGNQLVLTSADFGRAYLVERWASRFVTELFRNFTVLFLGYSLDDPVMRYLMDALAAERDRGVGFEDAFALTEEVEGAQEKWKLRNVEPIFYAKTHDHSAFHNTLRAWAEHWSGGLEGRVRAVRDLSRKDPAAIGRRLVELVTDRDSLERLSVSAAAFARTYHPDRVLDLLERELSAAVGPAT